MSDCLFCKIAKEEVSCSKVWENDKIVAFLDLYPVNKGHVLVIPKEHYETILDVPDDLLQELILVVKKLSKVVKDAMGAGGFNVGMNNYKVAGQIIPHAHFHIIPRFEDDGLKHWSSGKYEDGEIGGVLDKIKLFLSK